MRSFNNGNSPLNNVVIAPLWRRAVAYAIDAILILAIDMILSILVLGIYSIIEYSRTGTFTAGYNLSEGWGTIGWIVITCLIVIFILYHVLLLWLRQGYTPGKNFLLIRVLAKKGNNLSFVNALVRTLLTPVSAIPILLGYLLFLKSRKNSSLHDWIARTIVLSEEVEHEIVRDPGLAPSL